MVVWLFGRGFRIPRRAASGGGSPASGGGVAFYYSPPRMAAPPAGAAGSRKIPGAARAFASGRTHSLWACAAASGLWPRSLHGSAFPRFESPSLAREPIPISCTNRRTTTFFFDALVSQGNSGARDPGGILLDRFRFGVAAQAVLAGGCAGGGSGVSQMFTVFTMPTALIFYVTIAIAVAVSTDPVPAAGRKGARGLFHCG